MFFGLKIFGALIRPPFHVYAKKSVYVCVCVFGKNIEFVSSETKDSYQTFLCVHSVRKLWPLSSEK